MIHHSTTASFIPFVQPATSFFSQPPDNMTIEEIDPNHSTTSDQLLDWFGDSVSFFPTFLTDPYDSGVIDDIEMNYQWWEQGAREIDQDYVNPTCTNSINSTSSNPTPSTGSPDLSTVPVANSINQLILPESGKKRKIMSGDLAPSSQSRRIGDDPEDDGDTKGGVVVVPVKKSGGNHGNKKSGKASNCNNGNNKEGRWAEQLLNPCASAVTAGNLSRVQHFLYVLHELASPTGDANHRLAAHGLRALQHHLSSFVNNNNSNNSSSSSSPSPSSGSICFSSTEPKFFQRSLLKFYEVSPWFAFPNKIANSSVLQILSHQVQDPCLNLHILDIGVSHGVQWPTLLEALSRRPGGPPPLVRLTVVAAASDQNLETPFSIGPPGDNFSSRLLAFAKTLNINLQLHRLDNHPLQSLDAQAIDSKEDENLIVCAQFRLHHLNHNVPDERNAFLKRLRELNPKGVILSENNMDCSCKSCSDFATGFGRRVEYMWRFLDSTSSAFKGRESEERRVMEGEAAKALISQGEMNEGKEKWCERMREAGFAGEAFGEDAIDGGRALLRKYDGNWEMRAQDKDGCVGLWWKGQPVSFCSLWKLARFGENELPIFNH